MYGISPQRKRIQLNRKKCKIFVKPLKYQRECDIVFYIIYFHVKHDDQESKYSLTNRREDCVML